MRAPKSSSNHCAKTAGFTLPEALITVAIAVLISAIAIASMSETLNRRAVNHASALLVDSLSLSLKIAQKRSDTVLVCLEAVACQAGQWNDGWMILGLNRNDPASALTVLQRYSLESTRAQILGGPRQLLATRQGYFQLTQPSIFTVCTPNQPEYWTEIEVSTTQVMQRNHFFDGTTTTCTN